MIHFWVNIQRKGKQNPKEISALPYSLRQYSQQRLGDNLSVYQQMHG